MRDLKYMVVSAKLADLTEMMGPMNVREPAKRSYKDTATRWALPALLVAGLFLRLLLIRAGGFQTDIMTFEAWTISILDHGLANFYKSTQFADYPPGYFYILSLVGAVWGPFRAHDPNNALLAVLVKFPAIMADIGVGWLIFAICRRYASTAVALAACALYVFNPAIIFISADWGQVDAIAGGLALLAVYLLLKSDDSSSDSIPWFVPAAWVALACSLLIKPQAAVVIPLFIAFAFVDRSRMRVRIAGTAIGLLAAFFITILLVEPFHASSPWAALSWLLERYNIGAQVYQYNTVNAFNLWALRGKMWLPDAHLIGLGIFVLPQYVWGIGLVVSALALIIWRYVQEKSPSAFLQSCALALLAFFVLATRMHERYIFDGLLFIIVCLPTARHYLWVAITLSVVLFANLIYSLQYLSVVTRHMSGVDAQNLWGLGTSLFSLVTVVTFFVVGYNFLGATKYEETEHPTPNIMLSDAALIKRAKGFDPSEGLVSMSGLDYLIAAMLSVLNFILAFPNYWFPPHQYFDEVYYARAAGEYLANQRIYENTHPPVAKLLITLSTILFGGLQHGNDPHGWRFLNVVFGALIIFVFYVLAKRMLKSTLFATLAAIFFTADGMHFVQSRIATPEGLYCLFSICAVYAFYRFWIASQYQERPHVTPSQWIFIATAVLSLVGGGIVVTIWDAVWSHMPFPGRLDLAASIIVTLYVATGIYLIARYQAFPRLYADEQREFSFPDGSTAFVGARTSVLKTPDGGFIETNGERSKLRGGDRTLNRGASLRYSDDDFSVTYNVGLTMDIDSDSHIATYGQGKIVTKDHVERTSSAAFWLFMFGIAQGLFVSAKWNGVTGIIWGLALLLSIWVQPFIAGDRPTLWGNARGFRIDGALLTVLFLCASVYALSWVPDLARQSPDPNEIHNFNDVVARQASMYEYHSRLTATHPYSSKAWEWPIDWVPVAYFYEDHRSNKSDPNGCCVQEITSMPNPIALWLGLFSVPAVGALAWIRRRKAYALIFAAYVVQWAPWMLSPRIDFMYEFYVDIPLICLCNTIVLQEFWRWSRDNKPLRKFSIPVVAGVSLAIIASFIFFYPILSAQPITWNAWHSRMWFNTWIIGPG